MESYTVSCFKDDSASIVFRLGSELKTFIGQNTDIQMNKVDESKLEHAAREFMKFLETESIPLRVVERYLRKRKAISGMVGSNFFQCLHWHSCSWESLKKGRIKIINAMSLFDTRI